MIALTDFADQAVVLPLVGVIALALGLLGWWRGALVLLATVALGFGVVLVLKLGFGACGPFPWMPTLRSPSGHTAAGALLVGVIAAILGWRKACTLLMAAFAAACIGVTRVALGEHTPAEVLLGGAVGVAAVISLVVLIGPPPVRINWLLPVIMALAALLHGHHLNVEPKIRTAVAAMHAWCAKDGAWW